MAQFARILHRGALALLLVALAATTAWAGDPNGAWSWQFTGRDGQQFELTLSLKAEGEKLTGELALPNGNSIEIQDGTFKNDEVKFQTTFERNGNSFTTRYQGKVEGDTIKGTIERERDGETQSREWEATRKK